MQLLDAATLGHLSARARALPPDAWSAQHVATLANAWAKAEAKDEALWAAWAAILLRLDRSDLDLQASPPLPSSPAPPPSAPPMPASASCPPPSARRYRLCVSAGLR